MKTLKQKPSETVVKQTYLNTSMQINIAFAPYLETLIL